LLSIFCNVNLLVSIKKRTPTFKNELYFPYLSCHELASTTQEKKVPSHVEVEQENLIGSSSRPSTSSRRLSNKSLNGGFSNATPLNRRLSLGPRQLGTNSINSANQGISYIKEGRKIQGQKMFLRPDLSSHLRDEAASVVSSFSGPLSP